MPGIQLVEKLLAKNHKRYYDMLINNLKGKR